MLQSERRSILFRISLTSSILFCSVLAVVTAEIVEPRADRPAEGLLNFFTELSPMAAPDIRPGRQSDKAVEIGRVLERGASPQTL